MRLRRFLADRDALHSGVVALAALLLSGGTLYGLYLHRVWRTARSSPTRPARSGAVLVFGKHMPGGVPDADLAARLDRTLDLLPEVPASAPLYLLGGPTGGPRSEAAAMLELLRARGLPESVPVVLEDQSLDTLQNLRHARDLLRVQEQDHVLLVSNRYHLARCSLLASNLGLAHDVVAAEAEVSARTLGARNLLREAAYLMWIDVGTRYARGLGLQRMLRRVT